MDDNHTRARPAHADRRGDEARRRARFAREMARSVFGRSYWDDAMEAEKQAASDRKSVSQKKTTK